MPKFQTSDGISLHYSDEGTGPALLCLAGLTRTTQDFDYLADHLKGLRLIRMDYRGRGQSDWAPKDSYQIPIEARDTVELLNHLNLDKTAILGTSRGGLVAMVLAATVKNRLTGVALNDIGPVIEETGMEVIRGYLGRNPVWKTLDEAAEKRGAAMTGFADVPQKRWRQEVERFYRETENGLEITYDPALREAVLDVGAQPVPDLWPFFDAFEGLPLCALRGATSDILSAETFLEMQRRRPDMIAAEITGRGHVPFLDEPASLAAIKAWLTQING